jgi:glycosyltransferase involved in cell wall biosynthesis
MALRNQGHEVLLVSPPGAYAERLKQLGFRWVSAPMIRRSLNPLRELALILWLRRLLRSERVELVHGFTIKCAVYGSLAAALAGTRGRVNSVAGLGYVFTSGEFRARVLKPIVSFLLRVAFNSERSRVVLQNRDDAAFFASTGLVNEARIRLIRGSGVDCSRFTPDAGEGRSEDREFRVLLPSRLLWDKGLSEYAEASRLLHQAGRRLEFLVAGESDPGNPAAVPADVLQSWIDAGVLTWLRHVDDMPSLLRSVDAVVLPSYREGLPRALTEAAACGIALITTDVPGCRDVVSDQVDGLLVPVKDPAALASAIASLQDDVELRARLASSARRKCLAEFDERIIIAQTLDVYRELVPTA